MSVTDAYDYTDHLKKVLADHKKVEIVSKDFNELTDNADRVKFLESQLLKHNLIPTNDLKREKCEKTAEIARQEGNQKYKSKKFLKSLECYNKALCFSPNDHEMMGILYANRSAVYFELGHYEKCLENIDKAVEHNYKSLDKLKNREERCKSSLNNTSNLECMEEAINFDFLQLSFKPKIDVSAFIAECLELKSDKDFGRYVITNKKLLPGQIIAIDEPFSKCLIKDQNYKYCSNCLNDNCLSLYPCQNCTQAMFCSDECLKEGTKKFHRFECSIIDKLNEVCTKIMRISVHTFFEALDIYRSILDLMNSMTEIEGSPKTVFDMNKGGKIKRSQMLHIIDSLVTNEEQRSVSDLFQRSGIVAILTHLFLKYTPLNQVLTTQESQDFFRKFIFKQTQIAAINYHGIFDGVMTRAELSSAPQYASGSFPFCSLINHSCAPNLVRVSYNCKNYMMVNRPIEAGQQLFDNYGYHHCLEEVSNRQLSLKNQYMFSCTCEACEKNYPLYFDLPRIAEPKNFELFLGTDVAELSNLNYDVARNKFEAYCKYLNLLPYPSYEASSLQECILQCSFIFKMTPFKLKLLTC